jgi:hypothetical protein
MALLGRMYRQTTTQLMTLKIGRTTMSKIFTFAVFIALSWPTAALAQKPKVAGTPPIQPATKDVTTHGGSGPAAAAKQSSQSGFDRPAILYRLTALK